MRLRSVLPHNRHKSGKDARSPESCCAILISYIHWLWVEVRKPANVVNWEGGHLLRCFGSTSREKVIFAFPIAFSMRQHFDVQHGSTCRCCISFARLALVSADNPAQFSLYITVNLERKFFHEVTHKATRTIGLNWFRSGHGANSDHGDQRNHTVSFR